MGLGLAAVLQARFWGHPGTQVRAGRDPDRRNRFTIVRAGAEGPDLGNQGTTYWQRGGLSRSPTLAAVAVAGFALAGFALAWPLVNRRLATDHVGIRAAGLTVGGLAAGLLLIALFALSTRH